MLHPLHPSETQDAINRRVYHAEGVARFYTNVDLHPPEALALLHVFAEFPHHDVLDLGVGAGRTARYLAQLAPHYECLDYSPVMLEQLHKTNPSVSAHEGDMRDLSEYADESFDVVFASCNLIDAVSHADRLRVLAEVRRVLRPAGAFLFSSHNRNSARALGGPRLELTRNPVTQLRNLVRFARQTLNHARTGKFRKIDGDYALLDDSGHDYTLLHYYIDRRTQRAQLERAGFALVYAISTTLCTLGDGDDDSQSSCLHYIARRR
jgi:SAM-dependent methyltransferase